MFDPQDDPLGLGLKSRARERRQSQLTNNPAAQTYMSGPLPDQNWDAFFQAVDEANPGKPVKFAGGSDASSPVAPNADLGTAFAAKSRQFRGEPQGGNWLMGTGTHGENLLYGGKPQQRKNSLQSLIDMLNQGKF
jgi:hypothetical protein